MEAILLIVQLFLAIALIGIVLLQRSSTTGLGLGDGNGGGLGGFMSGRGSANILTRTTAFLAAGFLAVCMLSAILASRGREGANTSDLESIAAEQRQQIQESLPADPLAPAPTTQAERDSDALRRSLETNDSLPAVPTE